jgi:putative DNA primase/helicase
MSAMPPTPEGARETLAVPADQDAAFKFLDFIFSGVAGAFVEFRYFGPGRKPKVCDTPTYLALPLDRAPAAAEVLHRNGKAGIAVGPAPRCRIPGRGCKARDQDVLQVGCVWANLDYRGADGGAIEVIERVRNFPLRPSVTVNSGYGHHVYFVFHSTLRLGRLIDWSRVTGDLRAALRCEDRVTLSQVMRLPGTLNLEEPHPVWCEVVDEYSSWTRYGLDEVRAAVEHAQSAPSAPADASPPLSSDALRRRGVPPEIVSAVVTGRRPSRAVTGAGPEDGESGRDFVVASALLERGFGEEEIKATFRAHPDGCGSNWAQQRHGERYLELLLRKAAARREDARALTAPRVSHQQEDDEGAPQRALPPGYTQGHDSSVWFNPPVGDEDRKAAKPVKVSNSFIRIAEIQENIDTGQISLLIAFDYLGRTRFTPILRSQMSDARQLVAALAGEGAPVTSNNARLVIAYLAAYEHAFASTIPQKKVTSRFGRGRAGGQFFLPGLSSAVEFAPEGPGDAALYRAYSARRGSLQGWLEAMRVLASEHLLIPQAAVLAALVPPLQRRLQIPNFIFDIHGDTSTGKSTSLRIAASVYGKPHDPDSLILQWTNTRVAVEQVAGTCGELPVFLDDAQHCPAELKRSVIYMIANGRGKGRAARGGGLSETQTWHTVALSTSEEPLHEASPHEGARGRILSLGGLSSPFPHGASALVQNLDRAVGANHGLAGEVFVRHLNGWTESDWAGWQRRYAAVRAELQQSSSTGLTGRVSGYIAAIQLAAEVACPLLGLPFKPDVVSAWLMLHLHEQQGDRNLVLLAVRALADHYVANVSHFAGDGLHDPQRRGAVHGAAKRQVYVGFLRSTVEAVFRQRKWSVTAVLNKMAEAGVLYATEEDRHTKKISVGGVKHRMVCVKWQAIFPGEPHETEAETHL